MSLMMQLVERVRERVMISIESEYEDDDYQTASTETDDDYRERIDSILDEEAEEIATNYDRISEALYEWFSEDALMRTNHANLVFDVLGIDITGNDLIDNPDLRDMLILKACIVDDYRTMYPL